MSNTTVKLQEEESVTYVLFTAGPNGLKCALTQTKEIPQHMIKPGELAFVVKAESYDAMHGHPIEPMEK